MTALWFPITQIYIFNFRPAPSRVPSLRCRFN